MKILIEMHSNVVLPIDSGIIDFFSPLNQFSFGFVQGPVKQFTGPHWNKGLDCKQHSLGFKNVITTENTFVIILYHVSSGNTTPCKSLIMTISGTSI